MKASPYSPSGTYPDTITDNPWVRRKRYWKQLPGVVRVLCGRKSVEIAEQTASRDAVPKSLDLPPNYLGLHPILRMVAANSQRSGTGSCSLDPPHFEMLTPSTNPDCPCEKI